MSKMNTTLRGILMFNDKLDTKKSEKEDNIQSIPIEIMQAQLIQREGEAASQIIQAYKGTRYDTQGIDLQHKGRSFKEISGYNINPNYKEQNIKQQSGFTAELLHEARENKKYIREGSETRTRTTDGLGMTNDTHYDHVKVNEAGEIIDNSGSQMKFYGVSHKKGEDTYKVIEKMVKEDSWDRYGVIDVPKEQYAEAKAYAIKKSEELRKQAQELRSRGLLDQATIQEQRADRYEKASQRIRKTEITTEEAIMARLQPERFVSLEVAQDIGYAGVEAAAGAAVVTASLSAAQNLYAIASHEKNIDEAIVDVAKDTAYAGAIGFGVGAVGTSIKTIMHSSSQEFIRRCGNTLPIIIASSVVEVSKSIKRYANNEINELELVEELGEKGVGILASGYGATVGATFMGTVGSVIPGVGTVAGAAVGGFVGSMVGYSISSILYYGALNTLKMVDISYERRITIERIANEAINENKKYIDKLNKFLICSQKDYQESVVSLLENMQTCIFYNNVDGYISSIEKLGNIMGISLKIKTFEEFDMYMENEDLTFVF